MNKISSNMRFLAFLVSLVFGSVTFNAQELSKNKPDTKTQAVWFKRVLITNDNGIKDVKIRELARAFSKVAETYVVAPLENRSGSGHYLSLSSNRNLTIERQNLGEGIVAYGIDGFPADCVAFGVMGLMKNNPPDLVVSGINGGPNLSADSLGSGTIGAARVSAFLGIPAIAVSGLEDDYPEAVSAATQWVVDLSNSKIVQELKNKRYLTVSMPRKLPTEIKGIRVTYRAPLIPRVEFKKFDDKNTVSNREVWQMQPPKLEGEISAESDVALYEANFIVIVPMTADELDYEMLPILKNRVEELPKWLPPIKK